MGKERRDTNNKIVQARKEYRCKSCGKQIQIGEKYKRINVLSLGIFHFCLGCNNKKDIRKVLRDNMLDSEAFDYDYDDWYDDEVEDNKPNDWWYTLDVELGDAGCHD